MRAPWRPCALAVAACVVGAAAAVQSEHGAAHRCGGGCSVCADDPSGLAAEGLQWDLSGLDHVLGKSVVLSHMRSQTPNERAVYFQACAGAGGVQWPEPPAGFDGSAGGAGMCGPEDSACFCHAEFSHECGSLGTQASEELFTYESGLAGLWSVEPPYTSLGFRWHMGAGECTMGCSACSLTVMGVCDPDTEDSEALVEISNGNPEADVHTACGFGMACSSCLVLRAKAFCTNGGRGASCRPECYEHGTCSAGKCVCDRFFMGDNCQHPYCGGDDDVHCTTSDEADTWFEEDIPGSNIANGAMLLVGAGGGIVCVAVVCIVWYCRKHVSAAPVYSPAPTEPAILPGDLELSGSHGIQISGTSDDDTEL